MSGKEEKEYFCIWTDARVPCKIRTWMKLVPESLILFCPHCTELPLNKKRKS